jgi:hypothetical protein
MFVVSVILLGLRLVERQAARREREREFVPETPSVGFAKGHYVLSLIILQGLQEGGS